MAIMDATDTSTIAAARRFPAVTSSVGQARRFLLAQLPGAADGEADALVLMLSELATNAVQHAATEFEVQVQVAPDRHHVRVDVTDGATGFPTPQEQVADAPHGRGLHIVRTLADTWGIEMRRDQPGKTVWFSLSLAAGGGAGATPTGLEQRSAGESAPADVTSATGSLAPMPATAGTAPAAAATGNQSAWPVQGVRVVLDGLRDAVVATDDKGVIRYVNAAAEDLLGWPRGGLVGRPVFDLVPDSLTATVGEDYGAFVRSQAAHLVGRPLDTDVKRADGTDVRTELVISIFDHPLAGPVVVGILRARDDTKLQRWSELTSELLEILADAPIDEPPAERLLSTLGRRLDWDVTTLWTVSASRELVCRHVWTRAREGGRSDQRERGSPPMGHGARRAAVGPRPDDRQALRDGLTARGRAAERLRLPGPLPRRVRRDRQDAEPSPA
jgi:PAS domain S-box-containing protein